MKKSKGTIAMKPGRKSKKKADLSVKKSISFPPDQWAWIESYGGGLSVPSKVIQKAVRDLQERIQRAEARSKELEKAGREKIARAIGKENDAV